MRKVALAGGAGALLCLGLVLGKTAVQESKASPLSGLFHHKKCDGGCCGPDGGEFGELGGTWYWLRSPAEEKQVVMGLFNRYCIRCHGVDGRGVWDIPGVPNFTNPVWQASRSDGDIARIILEGRGAVMPPFRGTLSLEEAYAMARYLRTFLPGTGASKPDFGQPNQGTSRVKQETGPAPRVQRLALPPQ